VAYRKFPAFQGLDPRRPARSQSHYLVILVNFSTVRIIDIKLTPMSSALLEEQILDQVVEKFPFFYGTR
jgi:hypothetical protein